VPPNIDPADSHINFRLYVIKQLHEPLFSSSAIGKPKSRILDSWFASPDGAEYTFCLKPSLAYSNGKAVTNEDLWENFRLFDERGYLARKIAGHRAEGGCLAISFDAPYPRLTWDLMSYKTSIADPATRGERVVVGISPYRVTEIGERIIRLRAESGVRYREISFHYWRPGDEALFRGFDDINMVVANDIPADIDEYMNRYDLAMMKIYGMVINSANPELRSYLFNCLDIDKLRGMTDRKKKAFRDVGGVLPLGMPGAVAGRVKQECPAAPMKRRTKAKMVTFYEDCADEMREYLTARLGPLGIDAEVKVVDSNEMSYYLWSKEKPYDMAIIGIDSPLPEPISFFSNFLPGESALTNVRNRTLEKIAGEYSDAAPDAQREEQMRRANMAVIEAHQVLPLYQADSPLFYSKRVSHVGADQFLIGIPKIEEL
nr:hypothetical protein [bacterium]